MKYNLVSLTPFNGYDKNIFLNKANVICFKHKKIYLLDFF